MSSSNDEFWQQIDNEKSYQRLAMAIEFDNRQEVSLLVAVCDVDKIQQETIDRYTDRLQPEVRCYIVEIDESRLNSRREILDLVDREPYLQNGGKAVVSVIGATALPAIKIGSDLEKSARETFLGYLQWTRESFRVFHFPIVFWVSKNVYDLMSIQAPDFWSWRKGTFFFKDESHDSREADLNIIKVFTINTMRNDLNRFISSSPLTDRERLALRIEEKNPDNSLLISLYNSLGKEHTDRIIRDRYDDLDLELNLAIGFFTKAIDLARKSLDPSVRQDLGNSLSNLASLYEHQGKLESAKVLYQESLDIRRQLSRTGKDDNLVASLTTSLTNLANVYFSLQEFTLAEPLYIEALKIRRQLMSSSDIAGSLNDLGNLYIVQGKLSAAEQLLLEALDIYRQLPGDDTQRDLGITLNSLAILYELQGKISQAQPLYREALKMSFEVNPNVD